MLWQSPYLGAAWTVPGSYLGTAFLCAASVRLDMGLPLAWRASNAAPLPQPGATRSGLVPAFLCSLPPATANQAQSRYYGGSGALGEWPREVGRCIAGTGEESPGSPGRPGCCRDTGQAQSATSNKCLGEVFLVSSYPSCKLELIQTHMEQKPLRWVDDESPTRSCSTCCCCRSGLGLAATASRAGPGRELVSRSGCSCGA